jgi:hypothetical protein
VCLHAYTIHIYKHTHTCRGAQIPGTRSPARLNVLRWCLTFVHPQYGIRFMSTTLAATILRWLLHFWKICVPVCVVTHVMLAAQSIAKSNRCEKLKFHTVLLYFICWILIYWSFQYPRTCSAEWQHDVWTTKWTWCEPEHITGLI